MSEYEDLLKTAYSSIKEPAKSEERFSIPEPRIYYEGKTTVLENFADIADTLRRPYDHLMKHLLGELGTAGRIDGSRAVFNGKFEEDQIRNVIQGYIEDYVICSECGRPDTRLVKDGRVLLLQCEACGGHRPVRKRRSRPAGTTPSIQEGEEMTVTIDHLSRRGDGVAKIGKYIMYVANCKPGTKVRVRVNRVAGSIIFAERIS
ncbi:MAG: translation initiation factor IF-2 subunit beta [Methanoculleaceae archaeon]